MVILIGFPFRELQEKLRHCYMQRIAEGPVRINTEKKIQKVDQLEAGKVRVIKKRLENVTKKVKRGRELRIGGL